jgi:hypothetical protein
MGCCARLSLYARDVEFLKSKLGCFVWWYRGREPEFQAGFMGEGEVRRRYFARVNDCGIWNERLRDVGSERLHYEYSTLGKKLGGQFARKLHRYCKICL